MKPWTLTLKMQLLARAQRPGQAPVGALAVRLPAHRVVQALRRVSASVNMKPWTLTLKCSCLPGPSVQVRRPSVRLRYAFLRTASYRPCAGHRRA